ncbi:hypothetical protein AX16_002454 [Volvariella volvacea WC 439]|nr:hypothetical protein AX16_002454 [Volvariella volvacea WC 439]
MSWTSEWQRHVGSAPLRVTLDQPRYFDLPISAEPIHQAFPDFTLIGSLDVRGNLEFIENILKPYSDVPNPNIRHLTISAYVSNWGGHTPIQLFREEMPHLETLNMRNYDLVDWNSLSSFKSLKRLRISPPASFSLDILDVLQLLEELNVFISIDKLSNCLQRSLLQIASSVEVGPPVNYFCHTNVEIPYLPIVHILQPQYCL